MTYSKNIIVFSGVMNAAFRFGTFGRWNFAFTGDFESSSWNSIADWKIENKTVYKWSVVFGACPLSLDADKTADMCPGFTLSRFNEESSGRMWFPKSLSCTRHQDSEMFVRQSNCHFSTYAKNFTANPAFGYRFSVFGHVRQNATYSPGYNGFIGI